MRIIDGDLLSLGAEGVFDLIVHGCNCFNTMGAGIAKSIADRFPAAYQADLRTVKGAREKLGTITVADIECGDHMLTIVNAYTQYDIKRGIINANYDAIRQSFRVIKSRYHGKRLGYPMIGAGLAGGNWEIISSIIEDELTGEDHTLVRFKP